jgi:predicted AlkP superfamily phosphohydrolase/phosphomutase
MIIGFDGATFDLIQPWAEAGLLPTFKRLMDRGAWGPLKSTMPPVTPSAWSSMATGLNLGKHGVFDFFARKPDSYETYLVNATHRRGTPLWTLLSRAGRRVTVFNVPATYPPDPVNGAMVSGLLTPNDATDAAQPHDLLAELKQAVPGFSFYPPGIFSPGQERAFIQSVLDWDQMTLQATEFMMDRQPWDFLFTVFIGIDIVSHFMWQHMVTQGASAPTTDDPTHHGSRGPHVLGGAIQSVYRQADAILARLLEKAGQDVWVMVVSDHGFGPLDYYMHLNAWLVERGYLRFKRTPFVLLKTLAYRLGLTPLRILELVRKLGLGTQVQEAASDRNAWIRSLVGQAFLSLADVDWSRTTAYSAGFGGPIFLNLKGRQPQGIVEPGAESEALLQQLTADLRTLLHPVTGEPIVGEFFRPADLYWGPHTGQAPDLMPVPRDWRNQGYGLHDFASNRWLEPSPDRTGTHRMNGILLLQGPGIRPGLHLENAVLWDVAPTTLALMGVPIPKSVDGQVLDAALTEEMRARLTIVYQEEDQDHDDQTAGPVMSQSEEDAIRERLAALGYLG